MPKDPKFIAALDKLKRQRKIANGPDDLSKEPEDQLCFIDAGMFWFYFLLRDTKEVFQILIKEGGIDKGILKTTRRDSGAWYWIFSNDYSYGKRVQKDRLEHYYF